MKGPFRDGGRLQQTRTATPCDGWTRLGSAPDGELEERGLGGELLLLAGRELQLGGGDVLFELAGARRPGNGDHVPVPDEPCQGHLCRRGAVGPGGLAAGRG